MEERDTCPAFDVDVEGCEDLWEEPENCPIWAAEGECDANHPFMLEQCALSCRACILQKVEYRCARRATHRPAAYHPGDIHKVFKRAVSDYQQYKPVVHSANPWVVTFDDIIPQDAIEMFINHGKEWKRSQDAGKMLPDGTFENVLGAHRTSSTAWCTEGCYFRKPILDLMDLIADITQTPRENAEYPQVLRYQKNQWYNEHHDFIPGHLDLPMGPRLYTFFMYLSDVEEGGETEFTKLGIKIKPRKGRAIFWQNVEDRDPTKKHMRMHHQANHVLKGEKYSVNLWIHQYNFHEYFEIGCTG